MLLPIYASGQVQANEVDKRQLKKVIRKIKKRYKKDYTVGVTVDSKKDAVLKPVIKKEGLIGIDVYFGDNLVYSFGIDPETYEITEIIDLR